MYVYIDTSHLAEDITFLRYNDVMLYSVKPMSFIRFNPHIYLDYFLIKKAKKYTRLKIGGRRRKVKIFKHFFWIIIVRSIWSSNHNKFDKFSYIYDCIIKTKKICKQLF